MSTFDYKPELIARHLVPGADDVTFQEQGNLTKSPWEFRPLGQSGKMVSELVQLGELADEICFIHAVTSQDSTHGGENFMSTCQTLDGFPSAGAGSPGHSGSEAADLPAYVAIPDPPGAAVGVNNGPGFLPAAFGARTSTRQSIRERPSSVSAETDRATRFLQRLNQRHPERFGVRNSRRGSLVTNSPRHHRSASTLKMYGADTENPQGRLHEELHSRDWLLEKGVALACSSSAGPIRPAARASATGTA